MWGVGWLPVRLSWGCPTLDHLAQELLFQPGNSSSPLEGESPLDVGYLTNLILWFRGQSVVPVPYSQMSPKDHRDLLVIMW